MNPINHERNPNPYKGSTTSIKINASNNPSNPLNSYQGFVNMRAMNPNHRGMLDLTYPFVVAIIGNKTPINKTRIPFVSLPL